MIEPDSNSGTPGIRLAALTKSELLERIAALPCAPGHVLESCPAERLKMDLDTLRIELEAQNRELRDSQLRAEEARDRYVDLYDFAPVGYVTLSNRGLIREINLTGAALLGCPRKDVIGKPLLRWLSASCRSAFQRHLRKVCAGGEQTMDEMELHSSDGAKRTISLASTAIPAGKTADLACRTVLVDISRIKDKEQDVSESRQRLRDLSAHLDRIREDERHHLAREIHDDLGQKLTALRFEVAMLAAGQVSPHDLQNTTTALLKQVDDTIDAVRNIASDLRPAVLDLGLLAAVEWQLQQFQRRTGIACLLKIGESEINLDNARATAVFRIIQESLTNVARHADADKVIVTLVMDGEQLRLKVADNGRGMAPGALDKARSFGIVGMRERVLLLGGKMDIGSSPGKGTRLDLSIPMLDRRLQDRSQHLPHDSTHYDPNADEA